MYFDEIQYPEHSDIHDFLLDFTLFSSRQIQNIFQIQSNFYIRNGMHREMIRIDLYKKH